MTGLTVVCKLRHITDPKFWEDFKDKDKEKDPAELNRAAIRKLTELKRITYEKKMENPSQYGPFSDRVLELIRKFEQGQLDAAAVLKEAEVTARGLQAEQIAHVDSGLCERAYGIYKILEAFKAAVAGGGGNGDEKKAGGEGGHAIDKLKELAAEIHDVYYSDSTAPPGWHMKEQLRKELRGKVRRLVHPSGLENWKAIPTQVEEFAVKKYIKL